MMKKVRITVMKMACYKDLIEKYENPITHACDMEVGQVFIANGWQKPEGFCDSAWDSISPFVMTLAHGGGDFYDGWMKDKQSAMISCNDGFRPVSFLLEVPEESLIYGTGNPAKLQSMRDCLASSGITIIGLNEIGIEVPDVEESGNTPLENARIKALSFYKVLKRPVFACDSGFYIEGLPDEEQPGVHVRMVNGKCLNDEEMVAHYAAIAKRLGGKAVARYKNAICLVFSENEIYEHFGDDISGDAFCLTDKPHPRRIEGFPLDCISVHIESGEYYYWHEKDNDAGMVFKGFQAFFRKVLSERRDD